MAAGKYSFIIEQGSTTNFTIIYTDSTGAPIDLTSYGSKMQIRLTYDTPPIITLSSSLNADGTGLNMTNAASGAIGIYIASCTSSQFTFNDDPLKNTHYGFIAQDFENDFPELVSIKPDKNLANIKAINYLEIIPLLVNKIQIMQKEIDELKATVTNNQIHEKLKKI